MINKRFLYCLEVISGIILLFLAGFVLIENDFRTIQGLCIGVGAVLLLLGLINFIRSIFQSKMEIEKIKKLKEIQINDERNIKIKEKSSYMTIKVMNIIFFILIVVLGFINRNKIALYLVASIIIIEFILIVVFSNYYSKRL